ncbi:N-acetylmuramoyl-L-alanine amidase [Puniceicoccus vermicola]|uniref:N-acetylmuramoyl-L-alanine amidase n=1 Tax=Puniceicoccus vermicola TaxID=388746 RepID=A0A7X1B207_9BACT|nr:N-acetylmuramoyl-L-alanine amidase [Puniceicoccus vermicola]MBC2604067.1 N-acetylmuramoyl-L-alanine amidase [Puniceicoccus vermicola]
MKPGPGKFPGVTALFLLILFWVPVAEAANSEYIGLDDIADDLGLRVEWTERDRAVQLKGEWVTLDFKAASRIVSLNGIKVFLGDPALLNRGKIYISREDWRYSLQPILMPRIFPNPPGYRRVVIDAGHGDHDPGGQNRSLGLDEKDMALAVGRLIGERLKEEGFEVFYTRTDDTFIPLPNRPAIANGAKADIFLSIHFNAAGSSVRGVETYAYTLQGDPSSSRSNVESADRARYPGNANDPWNALLGYYLQSEVASATGVPDRGLKRARFAVLEDLKSPGVLLELGFITNQRTGRLLQTQGYRERLADAVVRGVRRYRQTLVRLHQAER